MYLCLQMNTWNHLFAPRSRHPRNGMSVLKMMSFFVQWLLDRNENTCHKNTTNLTLEQALSQIQDCYTHLQPHQQRILLDRISQLSQDQIMER